MKSKEKQQDMIRKDEAIPSTHQLTWSDSGITILSLKYVDAAVSTPLSSPADPLAPPPALSGPSGDTAAMATPPLSGPPVDIDNIDIMSSMFI